MQHLHFYNENNLSNSDIQILPPQQDFTTKFKSLNVICAMCPNKYQLSVVKFAKN